MVKKSIDEKLKLAREKLLMLQAQKQQIESRERAKNQKIERAKDTRRKILIGSMFLGRMVVDFELKAQLNGELDKYLERADDRALFELPNRVKSAGE